ncbi:MAG: hypothetical protein WBR15_09240 [Gammaproteobacteria bacterium]
MTKLALTRVGRLWLIVGGAIAITSAIVMNHILEGYAFNNLFNLVFPAALCALILIGICCIVVGLWPRKYKSYRWLLFSTACFTLCLYIFSCLSAWFLDLDWTKKYDCPTLYQVAIAQNVIPHSVSVPNRFAMFCATGQQGLFRTRYEVVTIYGVIDPREQNKVITTLKMYHINKNSLSIRIDFYQAENWKTWSSSWASGGTRGVEQLIRVAIIR